MTHLDADAIVIGSGSGGLNAALAMARSGAKVIVLEQHYAPGGWCHNFTKDGYTFCPGVHYIGRLAEGGETREIYEGLGVANELTFFEQNPDAYEHCDIAGVKFDYPSSLPLLGDRLQARFPHVQAGIRSYMQVLQEMVAQWPEIYKVDTLWQKLTVPRRTKSIGKYGLFSLRRILEARIADPVVRAILSVQCGDQGLPPGQTLMLLHAGLARHYEQGGFYPSGGGGAIAWAYVRAIKRAGGKVKVGAKVEKILVEGSGSKRRALGVRLEGGRELRAGSVISNADPHQTYLGLVGAQHLSRSLQKRLQRTRYSTSSLHLFLAVDVDPRAFGLDSGNVWYSRTADFDELFRRSRLPELYEGDEFDGLFLSAPTLKDPDGYNGKAHTLEVVTFVGYEAFRQFERTQTEIRGAAYDKLKEKITAMFMKTLERVVPGLGKHVVFSDLGTPLTNSHYINSTEGSVYGTEKSLRHMGPFAYRCRSEIEGLSLAGASTTAHGVSGAAMSGLFAAAGVLDCSWQSLLNPAGQALRVRPAEGN